MPGRLRLTLLAAALLPLVALALLGGGPRGAVDWRALRAVAFESDDWGLAGFVPAAEAWAGLERDALECGRFPEVYWESTLEDSLAVARLCSLLGTARGRDGRPAVFQPNYIMSSLALDPQSAAPVWIRRDLPDLPPQYRRPGLWRAVAAGQRAGVWRPELHGAWHYDPSRRRAAAVRPGPALEATRRGILLFPGSELARELGPWRPTAELAAELDHSLAVFAALFGRPAEAVVAPDYTWTGRMEGLWRSRGLGVIQGKREQRNPDWGRGTRGRLVKLAGRTWDRATQRGQVYLERNCRFEPVQATEPQAAAGRCLAETHGAWARGEPAVVETHRINFAHCDPAVVARGLTAFGQYLDGLTGDPDAAPLFLCDVEIARLGTAGTSWCLRGERLVVHNGSRSRRLVLVPAAALAEAARRAGSPPPAARDLSLLLPAWGSGSLEVGPDGRVRGSFAAY